MVYAALAKLKKNSVSTTLTGDIAIGDVTIPVAETSRFHDADGVLILKGISLGFDDVTEASTEEITITGASATSGAGNLTGVTRGVKADGSIGAAKAWPSGTKIAVMVTAGIYDQICDNIAAHESGKAATNQAIDAFGVPGTSNTDRDANTTNHGLLLKAVAPASGFMRFVGIAYGETIYALKELFDATVPSMNGTAAHGDSLYAAAANHVHDSDTSRAPLANPTFTGTVTTPAVKITGGTPGVGKVLTSDADGDATWETAAGGATFWTALANFTATPASTSTITMGTDQTATILVGSPLKYTIGGTVYYGMVAAITSNLLTVAGAPLGGDVTALSLGDASRIEQVDIVVNGYYEDADNTALIGSDLNAALVWRKSKSYAVAYKVWSKVHDSHATHGKATVLINATELNTSADGLTIAADATWYSTVVDIATAAYDINPAEAIEIAVKKGGTGDAHDLVVSIMFVHP